MTRRLIPTVLVLGAAVGAFALGSPSVEAEPTLRSLPVATLSVAPVTSYSTTRAFSGRVVARRTAQLGFERAGKLASVLVREGQRVRQGEALAQLDRRRLRAREAELEARLAQAAALLEEMQAGPRAETISATRARVRELAANVELLRRKLERRKTMTRERVTTQEELDAATFGLQAGIARRDALQRQLDELLAGTRAERLRAQRALVRQLGAQLEQVRIDTADSVLVAPFSGAVATVDLDEGTVVAAGQAVLRLVEREGLEAWVGVPPAVAARLQPGSVQQVLVEGTPYAARVQAILPELDRATRTSTVVMVLDDGAALLPNQVVRLIVHESTPVQGFWLPLSALTKSERDLWSCLVVRETEDGSVAQRRLVKVISIEADRVLVDADLTAGVRVVASGTNRIVVGQRVVSAK